MNLEGMLSVWKNLKEEAKFFFDEIGQAYNRVELMLTRRKAARGIYDATNGSTNFRVDPLANTVIAGVAVAGLAACGNTINNYYDDDDSGNGGDDDSEGSCGNSPLTGWYLWNVGCTSGSVEAFTEDCRGLFDGGREVTFDGLVITMESGTITLRRNVSRSDFASRQTCSGDDSPPTESQLAYFEAQIDRTLCYLESNSDLFIGDISSMRLNGICPGYEGLFILRNSPFPGEGSSECTEMRENIIDSQCNEDNPLP